MSETGQQLRNKDIVGIKDLSCEEIELILNTAVGFRDVLRRDIKKVPTLRGKTVVNLFFEPSTRTRTSFELAAKRLSTDVINFSVSASSVVKGESLIDTAMTIQALGADVVIIRHSSSGVPHLLAKHLNASVINAGDGINEHPTQALLDAFTIMEKNGRIKGLRIAIVGDILHSRVAGSLLRGLKKMGAGEIRVCAPPTFLPKGIEEEFGCKVYYDLDEAIKDVDVVYALRVQLERAAAAFIPSVREYSKNGRDGKVVNFIIADDTGNIKVVLWDVNHIELIENETIKKGDVVEIKNGVTRENEIHLSGFGGFKKSDVKMENVKTEAIVDEKTIEEAKQGQMVKIRGVVVQLFQPRFYSVCPECNKKVTNISEESTESKKFKCAEHGEVSPKERAILNFVLDDGTESMRVVMFSNQIEKLIPEADLKDENKAAAFRDDFIGTEIYLSGIVKRNQLFNNLEIVASSVEKVDIEKLIEKLNTK